MEVPGPVAADSTLRAAELENRLNRDQAPLDAPENIPFPLALPGRPKRGAKDARLGDQAQHFSQNSL